MRPSTYLNVILTAIAALLCAILLVLVSEKGVTFEMPASAYAAQTQSTPTAPRVVNDEQAIEFHPWINPRRFIFWDPAKREIYIYDDDGELEVTWVVGRIGENLTRKRD